ncbi:MAG: formate--tetrahydrofolate ligase [Omnitrophica bacterium GWA2_41_15]|nr:MAG: formate--tetrahydrofolate ligase [Omnitrophica bacterium GWA2_41_15]HAZ11052.1 formate--tetrahydrofolate ligase [Candidatus Omnitrophota bacterium]
MKSIPSDLEIAQSAKLKPIIEIAKKMGIKEDELELYGRYKAKITLSILGRLKDKPFGKYIDVTAITPTPLGEGKTVTTIGLSLGLHKLRKKVITTLRQPSMGPVFGIKGGAAGGGYSQVLPMEDINLHFTGDIHAVGAANNLLAAFIDNSIVKGNKLNINPDTIITRRVVDISDRALRQIKTGLGGEENGIPRDTGFDITVASEVMAILALSKDLFDLRSRIGKMIAAFTYDGLPITAENLKCAGAMAVLLKDAIKPNLVQTTENTPCIMHAGPFANIAHGNNSILADMIALKLSDYVVTESGFGADCGAEKFMDIKCRIPGLKPPDAVVIVCTVRALKMHGGAFKAAPGKKIDEAALKREDVEAVKKGASNLEKHIENIKLFGVPVVVAINRFLYDTDKEIAAIKEIAIKAGAEDAVLSEVWEKGGEGGVDLAKAVIKMCEKKSDFKFLYPLDISIKEKIEIIAKKIYGARDVSYMPEAERKIDCYTKLGYDKLPICMAKTHLSLSHDPELKARPMDFTLPIRDVRISAGAGFLYPLCGEMRTMPGLPSVPAGTKVDIDKDGKIVGLF